MVIIPYRVECICDRTERIYNIGGAPPTVDGAFVKLSTPEYGMSVKVVRLSFSHVCYGIQNSGFHRPTRFYCHDAEEIFQSRIARPPINFFLLPPKTT